MNPEAQKSAIRSILIGASCLTAGWFAQKGYISSETVSAMLNSPVAAALATAVAGMIWGLRDNTDKNLVKAVTKMGQDPASPVRGVIVENNMAGHELATSIEGPVEVAGSIKAAEIAKT